MSKNTKHFSILGFSILILFANATFLAAQEGKVDEATVPFSNPGQPGTVKISLYMGGITVTGYSGQEVIVEARVRGTMLQEQDKEVNEKARGMRLIRSSSTGLTITEEDNVMSIGSQSMRYPVDITARVPVKTTLKLGGYQSGNITVENITGEIEVNNYNGSISLTGITGSVVANTFNGGLKVVFAGITPDKPMSFSTWNGDVDITLPADLRSTVKLYSEQGDIYSDFEIQMQARAKEAQKTERKAEGRFKIVFDKTIYGTIGGGGPEFSFKTYNGDVYLRKK
jgi:DUF4097 and DUF4098 domain-containing protein YvlB